MVGAHPSMPDTFDGEFWPKQNYRECGGVVLEMEFKLTDIRGI